MEQGRVRVFTEGMSNMGESSLAGTTAAPSATGPCTCMLRHSELAFAVAAWPDAIPHIGAFISLSPSVGDLKAPF